MAERPQPGPTNGLLGARFGSRGDRNFPSCVAFTSCWRYQHQWINP
jgi:hypothetical protein